MVSARSSAPVADARIDAMTLRASEGGFPTIERPPSGSPDDNRGPRDKMIPPVMVTGFVQASGRLYSSHKFKYQTRPNNQRWDDNRGAVPWHDTKMSKGFELRPRHCGRGRA